MLRKKKDCEVEGIKGGQTKGKNLSIKRKGVAGQKRENKGRPSPGDKGSFRRENRNKNCRKEKPFSSPKEKKKRDHLAPRIVSAQGSKPTPQGGVKELHKKASKPGKPPSEEKGKGSRRIEAVRGEQRPLQ